MQNHMRAQWVCSRAENTVSLLESGEKRYVKAINNNNNNNNNTQPNLIMRYIINLTLSLRHPLRKKSATRKWSLLHAYFWRRIVIIYLHHAFYMDLKHTLSQCASSEIIHSSGAPWESRWPSWAVRPNEPSGFRGRKELLNRASALVSACP